MKGRLRRLLKPAETSPADVFTWTDKRPIREQVASGFRKAALFVVGGVVMFASFLGLAVVSDYQSVRSSAELHVAWTGLAIAAIIMTWTANRWAPYVTGFFFGPAVLKIAAALFLEPDSYYSANSISRTAIGVLLAYALAVVALASRFLGKRPASTTVLDRACLTVFVFSVFRQAVIPQSFPPWPLLLGLLALLASWSAYRSTRKSHKTRHRLKS